MVNYLLKKKKREGPICGVKNAKNIFGFENTFDIDKDLETFTKELLYSNSNIKTFYYDNKSNLDHNIILNKIINNNLSKSKLKFIDSIQLFNLIRMIKSESEINILKKCSNITSEGFISAMKQLEPGMMEYQIESILEYEMKMRGAERLAYLPVWYNYIFNIVHQVVILILIDEIMENICIIFKIHNNVMMVIYY
jgi:Xaa-Pro aminopeptidase